MKKFFLLFFAIIFLSIASIYAQGGAYVIKVYANPPEGGTVTGGGTYGYLDAVTVKAFPNPNYDFEYWDVEGVLIFTGPVYTFHATYSYHVIANFKKKVDIKETSLISDIYLIPNPTSGEFTMDNGQLTMNNEQLIMNNIEVFDIYGRKQNVEFNSYGLTVLRSYGLTNLPAGIYFVKITSEQGVVIKKVIKQ